MGGAGRAEALNFQRKPPEIEGICGPGGRGGRGRKPSILRENRPHHFTIPPLASVVNPLVNGRLLDVMNDVTSDVDDDVAPTRKYG